MDRDPVGYEFDLPTPISAELLAAFPGLELIEGGTGTRLRGPVTDQDHLHHILRQFQGLGLELEGLRRMG